MIMNDDKRREVIWVPQFEPGLEHLHLSIEQDQVRADSLVIGVADGRAFRAHYVVRADAAWRVREFHLALLDGSQPALDLLSDGEGHWTTAAGAALPELTGCIDVDVMVSPFTNTLPIRRLSWRPGDAVEIAVVYLTVPALTFAAVRQRYTCLEEPAPEGGRFRYESLSSSFVADLLVDRDGLVIDYPGIWRQTWSDGVPVA